MSTTSPLRVRPARMVPPYTMSEGRSTLASAIITPGMFLSHPGMAIAPSYHCPRVTVSIESAMRSRDCNEKDMPSVPIDIPSLTPTVL